MKIESNQQKQGDQWEAFLHSGIIKESQPTHGTIGIFGRHSINGNKGKIERSERISPRNSGTARKIVNQVNIIRVVRVVKKKKKPSKVNVQATRRDICDCSTLRLARKNMYIPPGSRARAIRRGILKKDMSGKYEPRNASRFNAVVKMRE